MNSTGDEDYHAKSVEGRREFLTHLGKWTAALIGGAIATGVAGPSVDGAYGKTFIPIKPEDVLPTKLEDVLPTKPNLDNIIKNGGGRPQKLVQWHIIIHNRSPYFIQVAYTVRGYAGQGNYNLHHVGWNQYAPGERSQICTTLGPDFDYYAETINSRHPGMAPRRWEGPNRSKVKAPNGWSNKEYGFHRARIQPVWAREDFERNFTITLN